MRRLLIGLFFLIFFLVGVFADSIIFESFDKIDSSNYNLSISVNSQKFQFDNYAYLELENGYISFGGSYGENPRFYYLENDCFYKGTSEYLSEGQQIIFYDDETNEEISFDNIKVLGIQKQCIDKVPKCDGEIYDADEAKSDLEIQTGQEVVYYGYGVIGENPNYNLLTEKYYEIASCYYKLQGKNYPIMIQSSASYVSDSEYKMYYSDDSSLESYSANQDIGAVADKLEILSVDEYNQKYGGTQQGSNSSSGASIGKIFVKSVSSDSIVLSSDSGDITLEYGKFLKLSDGSYIEIINIVNKEVELNLYNTNCELKLDTFGYLASVDEVVFYDSMGADVDISNLSVVGIENECTPKSESGNNSTSNYPTIVVQSVGCRIYDSSICMAYMLIDGEKKLLIRALKLQ